MNTQPNTLSTGLQHQRAGRVAEAEQVYKLLLQEQPHSVDALNLLGALVYEDKRFEEAQNYFERVLTLQPGAESHNSMGIVLKAQGKHAEAVEHYQQALALKPNQPEVLSNLGNALKELGKLEEAIAAYQQALSLNPAYAEAHSNLGIAYKDQDKLDAAIACYREAIRLKPNYAEAHHNLGIVLRQQNQLDEAVHYFRQAIALKPNYADAYTSLGSTLQQQGKDEEAIACYQHLIQLKPNYAEGFNNLGLAYQHQGKIEEAIAAFQQALTLQPNFPGVCNNLGNLLLELDRVDEAIASYRQAIAQRPNYPEALNNLGNALQRQGKLDEAVTQYEKALELRPNFVEALSNLGAVLKDQHKLEAAVSYLEQAVSLGPSYAEIHNNLGNAYQEQKRVDEAIACYRAAVALKPEMAEVHSNLGNMLQYIGEFEEAFEHFEQAIAAQPDFAGVYNNLGIARRNAGQVQEAFAAYNRALELKPDFVEAHWNTALNHLLLGNLKQGFEGYEWRFQWSRFIEQNPSRSYSQPRWDGSPLDGKTILLYAEQGMGDILQFIRYVPLVKAKGGRIIVECHAPLINLFKALPDIDQLIPLGETILPSFDTHAPLMSLPYILGTTLETIPAKVPYLVLKGSQESGFPERHSASAQSSRQPTEGRRQEAEGEEGGGGKEVRSQGVATNRILLPHYSPTPPSLSSSPAPSPIPHSPTLQFKIGVVWDGNPQNPYNRTRAVPLAELLPLATIPGVMLYSLQKEPKPEDIELLQAHPEVQDLRSQLNDFTDTAAIINQLDLIISIDTAVTHLAGALGKPTWLLLPLAPDWRWMVDRSDSPWYPTMRLFRQSTYGDWEPVLAEVRQALEKKVGVESQEAGVRRQKAGGRRQAGKKKKGRRDKGDREGWEGKGEKVGVSSKSSSSPPPAPSSSPSSSTPSSPPKTTLPTELRAVVKLHQAGQIEEARRGCEAFLQQSPDSADGWHLLGLMAHHDRKLDEAIAHYQNALKADDNHLDTYNNLAVALHEQGKLDEAMPYYQKALALKPDNPDAHNNYANLLRERSRLDEAIYHYQQAIAARPDYPDAYNNLGLAHYAKGDFASAAEAYRQAVERKPNFPQALNHLGNAFKELGNFAEAAKYYQQAIALKPDYAKAYNNWGNIFRDEGDLQTAVQYYDQATAIDPNFAEAHWNKALTLLLGGDLQRGFEEYEWRRHVNLPSFKSLRDFPGPRWDGAPLNGQLIYLHAEQGMGDIIQFVRYVPLVVQQGGRVILECHPPLMNLFSNLPGVERLVPYGSSPPGYHIQAPLLSLPYIFGTSAETVPATVPYIHPPRSSVCLPASNSPSNLKVGIVWSGNPENPYNRTRAVPLDLLLPLVNLPNTTFYSLQKDLQPTDQSLLAAYPQIHDLRSLMPDFVDTAALIQQLDLVISIDTAVTHLAGALGKPTWLLLPFAPDWRWMLHRDDSPWYPTLQIFRQPTAGDWESVLHEVREKIGRQEAEGKGVREWMSGRVSAIPSHHPPIHSSTSTSFSPPSSSPSSIPTFTDRAQLLNAALQIYQSGNLGEAENRLRQVLEQQPDDADALHILGVILCQMKRFEEAIRHIQRLVELQPQFAEGWKNLGSALQEQGKFEEAIASYQRAIALEPNHPDVHQNLSTALLEMDRPFEAVTHAERVVALKPDFADGHYNLGYALRRAGHIEAAIASYQQAIALKPDMALAHKNLGHALLLTGEFPKGFQEIEWRWQQPGWAPRPLTQPAWDGSDLTGKTILLYAEQGMGDTLQFIRYVPFVKAKGGRVIVECQAALLPLLSLMPAIDQLVAQDSSLPDFDVHAPLMSLPRIFGTTVETVPADIPYILVEKSQESGAEGVREWMSGRVSEIPSTVRLSVSTVTLDETAHAETHPPIHSSPSPFPTPHHPSSIANPLKVGIVWAGNPGHRNDRFRSCKLEQFRPVLEVANVEFYSLQKGEAEKQLQAHPDLPVQDLSDRLQSFVDTAIAISQLDLVITVDTAVAHLAGALGKPVWLLLMFAADWRWIADRDDTPWYPTMRLFRQTSPGDWAGVFERVAETLREEVRARKQEAGDEEVGEWMSGGVREIPFTPSPLHPSTPPPLPSTHSPIHSSTSLSSLPPLPTSPSLTLTWQLDDFTDWGIVGTQLALGLLQSQRFEPVLLQALSENSHANPLQRSRLQQIRRVGSLTDEIGLTILDDRLHPVTLSSPNPEKVVGLVTLENTTLDAEAIERAKQFRAIATGSRWSADVLRSYGLNPVQIPLQGIDPTLFYPGAKTGIWGDRFVVFSNAISHVKGHDSLLAAFTAFQARHPDALLLLAGAGSEPLPELSPDAVLRIEAIAYPLLGQVLREADVAVFPSRCEAGLNQAIAASLACGIPTVLSNNTANQDLIRHNLGFPLHAQRPVKATAAMGTEGWGESDVEELVETLEYIYTHRQEARNRGMVAADFLREWTWQQQIQQWMTLLFG
ncbi:MAG: tetratricopeptide repeat protein [Oscillatoriales cyanobacterium C42_A2020_001]|nr:tetratricopeptide repeat protein [Leptolyngbyaceae cyanobacterium C42_A2020_001]